MSCPEVFLCTALRWGPRLSPATAQPRVTAAVPGGVTAVQPRVTAAVPAHVTAVQPSVTAGSSSRAVTRGPSRAGSGWRLDGRWQHPTDRRTDGPAAVSPREAPQPWQWHRGTEPGLCHPHHTGKLSATTIQTETLKSAFPALGSGIPSSGLSSEPSWPPTGHGL